MKIVYFCGIFIFIIYTVSSQLLAGIPEFENFNICERIDDEHLGSGGHPLSVLGASDKGLEQTSNEDQNRLSAEELMKMDLEDFLNIEVISASKKKERLYTAPAIVYVITREEIERFGFMHLQDALVYIPSVYLYNPHSWVWGGQRGLVSNFSQTLLMINGREMNNLIAQEGFISRQFSMHNIERIEVMASPGSALYGANALAGVINIITREANPDYQGVEFNLWGGSYNTTSAELVFGKSFKDIAINGSIRLFNSDEANFLDFVRDTQNYSPGWVDNPHAIQNITEYKNPSNSLPFNLHMNYKNIYCGVNHYYNRQSQGQEKLRWNYTDGEDHRKFTLFYGGFQQEISNRIKVKLEYQRTWSFMWGRYHSGFWPVSRLESSGNFDLYSFPDEVITSNGDILHGEEEIKGYYPSFGAYLIDQGILSEDSMTSSNIQRYFTHIYTNKNSRGSQRQRIDSMITWQVTPKTILDFGYVYDYLNYVGLAVTDAAWGLGATYNIPIDLSKRKDVYNSIKHGVYFQLKTTLLEEKFQLNLGCRYDNQNNYGDSVNPRIGMIWQASKRDIIKILYGEAFREPNVFELSSNPNVKPAKLRSLEANYSHQFGKTARISLTVYKNLVSDYLNSVGSLIGSGVGKVEKQRITGLEFQFHLKKNPFFAFINGAWLLNITQDSRNNENGQIDTFDVLGIPKRKINLGISYTIYKNLTLSFLYSYRSQYKALSGNIAILDPFRIQAAHNLRINLLVAAIKLAKYRVDLTFVVNNLLNSKNYQANIRRSGPHQFLQEGRHFIMGIRIRD